MGVYCFIAGDNKQIRSNKIVLLNLCSTIHVNYPEMLVIKGFFSHEWRPNYTEQKLNNVN